MMNVKSVQLIDFRKANSYCMRVFVLWMCCSLLLMLLAIQEGNCKVYEHTYKLSTPLVAEENTTEGSGDAAYRNWRGRMADRFKNFFQAFTGRNHSSTGMGDNNFCQAG
ncbi:MAG: hypothetical protein HQK50_19470 [Oligoflexia bacterium]|nr:hypothetical protein [Oligoflexia bacterium]